ncbi:MAG: class I SAM-dependent methyltransferase [Candidatus Bathyarchaeota archaeon]
MNQFRCPKGPQGKIVAASMNRGHDALTNWGLKNVEIKPQFIILDVGCGGGKTVSKLANLAFQGKVFGIDPSPDMVKYSKQGNNGLINKNKVSIEECSVEKLNFPNDFFDLVTAIETYYFWFNLPKAFKEIKRVLKPKGKLILINEMIKDGIFEVENAEIISKTHVNLVPLTEIKLILQSIGFIKIETISRKESAWNTIIAQKQ